MSAFQSGGKGVYCGSLFIGFWDPRGPESQKTAECAIRHSGRMAETTAVCRGRKAEKVSEDHKGETPIIFPRNLAESEKDNGGITEYGTSIYETVSEIQPFAVH